MSVTIQADALGGVIRLMETFPDVMEQSAVLALNQMARRDAIPMLSRESESQTNFPNGYVRNRLSVRKFASRSSMSVTISGRDRPTSLARFATSAMKISKAGVHVKVKRQGGGAMLEKAFPVRLPAGKGGNAQNLGLAIRLKNGSPSKAYKPVKLVSDKNGTVWLLYGPSVDQVLAAVGEAALPDLVGRVEAEFYRQFSMRINRG